MSFWQQLISTPASRAGVCPCACHTKSFHRPLTEPRTGRIGTPCPDRCTHRAGRLDGCHGCGCPGTACVLGECYTASRSKAVSPIFGLGEVLQWNKQPEKLAQVVEVHLGAYEIELRSALPYAGRAPGYRFTLPFAEAQECLRARPRQR